MDWEKFEKSLRQSAKDMQKKQLAIPANSVASTAAVGGAAIVLTLLADAVAAGRQS